MGIISILLMGIAVYGVPVGYTRIYRPDPKNIKKGC